MGRLRQEDFLKWETNLGYSEILTQKQKQGKPSRKKEKKKKKGGREEGGKVRSKNSRKPSAPCLVHRRARERRLSCERAGTEGRTGGSKLLTKAS